MAIIAWVGCYPAHYTRVIHRALEERFPDKLAFIYSGIISERAYERGDLPRASFILERGSPWEVHRILCQVNPRSIIVAGHFPRAAVYAALWGFMHKRAVNYYADTNLLDVLLKKWMALWLRRVLFKSYFRLMHYLLYPGSRTRDYYVWVCGPNIKESRMQWLPYVTLESCLASPSGPETVNNELQFLYVGRLVPEKAVDCLIRGIGLLPSSCREKARFRIAGDGPERALLEKLVLDLSIQHVIEFLGAVPSDQVAKLFNHAAVFVLPSHHEPWGVVVSEAMAAGLPVIAPYWVGAVADLVADGRTGIVMNGNSPQEIAKAIEYFITDPAESQRMGRAAREVIERSNLTIDTVTALFSRVIREGENPSKL